MEAASLEARWNTPAALAPSEAEDDGWFDTTSPAADRARTLPEDARKATRPPAEDPWDPAEEVTASLSELSELSPTLSHVDGDVWAPGVPSRPAAAGSPGIADALERIAHRLRAGDLILPPGASASTDAAALAIVLAGLLGASAKKG